MILKVLGAGSATPALGRYPSAFALETKSETFLIDCGEGTQWRMLECNVKHAKINHIFISHLHGDHFLGLVGLVCTMNSLSRKQPLHIYAPVGLKEILSTQFRHQETRIEYDLHIHELAEGNSLVQILETKWLTVSTFPLSHRVPTFGFLFKEKERLRNIIKHQLPENILLQHIHQLKLGNDVYDESGKLLYSSQEYTTPAPKSLSFAYCSDTCFFEPIIAHVSKVDLLYHEATFLQDKEDRAKETFHSTAMQAATIARMAQVKKLLIGHYSARYKETEPFLIEAKAEFQNTELAHTGSVVEIQ